MPRTRRIQPEDFGPLYHGGAMQGVTEIDQRHGGHRYSAMPGTAGFNYATTDFDTAKKYATEAAAADRSVPSVYEVTPSAKTYSWRDSGGIRHRGAYQWGVDEHSGPSGWYDNTMTKSEAAEIASYGGEVSLKFEAPLKAREIWSEDRAQDITPGHKSFT